MKKIILIVTILLFTIYTKAQNATIEVIIENPNTARIKLTSGGQEKKSINDLDFADGMGKIIVTNKTKDNIRIEFIDNNANSVFQIPAKLIGKKSNDTDPDAVTNFVISKTGKLPETITSGEIKKELGIVVHTESKSQAATLAAVKASGGANSGIPSNTLEYSTAEHLRNYVEKEIAKQGYNYVGGQNNLIIDDKGIIHIYIDEDGNPIYNYFPVSAKENYDKFQIHILSTTNNVFIIASTGEFSPIEIRDEVDTKIAVVQSGGAQAKIHEFKSPIFGPYTRIFPFTIHKKSNEGDAILILDKSIKLLKTNRVSINTGVVSTWLRSPESITTFVMPNGDTTLVADDPNVRGYLTLMLTFHIKPRNLNIQPRNPTERLGISVGTNISSNAFDNFFLGLNVELTNGLFLNGGGHFGRVNHVVNYNSNFKYGEEKFSGTLLTRKKWNFGTYLSVNIDAALFAKVFKNIFSSSPNNGEL